VDAAALEGGAAAVLGAAETFRMPAEIVRADPQDHAAWLAEAASAVGRVLGERAGA
jgi:hypothetical protein